MIGGRSKLKVTQTSSFSPARATISMRDTLILNSFMGSSGTSARSASKGLLRLPPRHRECASRALRRLLGSLPYLMDLDTRHRSRVAVLQFVCRERGDSSFLISSDLVRECTGLKMKDGNSLYLVDGVCAVVSDRFYKQSAAFLEIRLAARVFRHDFRIVGARDYEKTGTCDHEEKTTVCVEDVDTLRIGAKLAPLAAVRAHLIR